MNQKKDKHRKKLGNKAQAFIEYSVAIVVLFMFLLGTAKIFFWFNRCLSERQENYEKSRIWAGNCTVMADPLLETMQYAANPSGKDSITVLDPLENLSIKPHLLDGFYNSQTRRTYRQNCLFHLLMEYCLEIVMAWLIVMMTYMYSPGKKRQPGL